MKTKTAPNRLRAFASKLGSLLLLFQRSPLVQMLFPEARVLGGAGLGELAKWSVATVAGLGAYDTVAGATTVSQLSPISGGSSVTGAVGSGLSFVFQVAGSPGAAGSWTVSQIPPGLTHGNPKDSYTDTLSGIASTAGTYSITATAWENTNFTGGSSSKTFTLTIDPAIIATQPASSVVINSGGTATLSVTASSNASGYPLTYQWYQGASGVTTAPISGATSSSYTTPALTSATNYWVKVTQGTTTPTTRNAVSANSTTAGVSIATIPAISTQPAAVAINSGSTATLTVVASGNPAPSYQWYQGTAGVTTTPVGNNSSTFTTPPLAATTSYWVRVSNSAGNTNSNAATVTVNQPATITSHPASSTINSGASTTLSVSVSGTAPFAYQWYQGTTGVTTSPVGTNSASYTTPALTSSTSYWVKVTNTANPSGAQSNTALITVNQPAAISSQPGSVTVNSGTSTTLNVTATGTAPFTYQWYQGASGVTTTPVGTNSSSFTTPALTASTSYWVKITNAANPSGALSNTANITVNPIETFANWRSNQFTPAQQADPLISGPNADPDGDGITNEQEYLFGLIPLVGNPSPAPAITRVGSDVSLSFTAKAAVGSGYTGTTRHYALESTDSPGSGTWIALPGYQDIVATGQTVSYTAPASGLHRFYHLRVWLTP